MKSIGVLINDPHLNKNNDVLVENLFLQAISVCKKYDTDVIFCSGDMFTNRSGQPLSTLASFKRILRDLSKNQITLYTIPGNHDKTDADDVLSYISVYNSKSLKLFSTPAVVDFMGVDVTFLPYFSTEVWLEYFNSLPKINHKKKNIIITHVAVNGVKNNDGSVVENNIPASLFKDYDKVFIGHYHDASKIGKNVYYAGSLYQNNYGERYEDKGFTVIFEDASFEFVQSSFPIYRKINLNVNDAESISMALEEYKNNKSDFIRFVFSGKREDAYKIQKEEFAKYGIDVKFDIDETKEAIESTYNETIIQFDKKTVLKDFMAFCSENNIKGNRLVYGVKKLKGVI